MKFDKVAVVAERELALGFKLIGVKDVFIAAPQDEPHIVSELMDAKTHSLIMVSESAKKYMSSEALRSIERSLYPLVVFIPLPGVEDSRESVEALAKRVLGVDIKGLKK
ncbi:MAG: V-type ATP synthase subunit F [Candidatus Marsarchaeota archaeon]|nr:V-type ATP synthase subunit F [Candidatus Marsarchaeota archaeon]